MQALIDLGSEYNLINAAYAKGLGIPALLLETNLKVQAIDRSPLPSITHRTIQRRTCFCFWKDPMPRLSWFCLANL